MSAKKKFKPKINELTAQNQSSILQNSADIHYVHSRYFSRLT